MLALEYCLGGKVTPPLGGVLGLLCAHLLHPPAAPNLFFFFFLFWNFLIVFLLLFLGERMNNIFSLDTAKEGKKVLVCFCTELRPSARPQPHHVQFIPPSFLFRLEGAEGRKTKRDDRRGPQASEG